MPAFRIRRDAARVAAIVAFLAAAVLAGDEHSPPESRCVLRGEVLRADAPAAARVEIRRVQCEESTPADTDWYRRVAAQRALFATLADGPPLRTLKADAAGAFEAADLPLGVYEVRAVAEDGTTCCVAARATASGEIVRVTADVPGGALTVKGRAVRRDGAPFRGLVAIDARDFGLREYGGSAVVSWPGAVETGADGKFEIRGVPDGLHRLVALTPGAFVARSARFFGAAAPEFVVDGGESEIAGIVVDGATGAPVPGAVVACPAADDPAIAVAADARGAFRLAVPDGGSQIAATAPGFLREVVTARAGAGATIRLVRGATLSGRVAARDGTPVRGARVLAVTTAVGPDEEERVARTGADGRFEIAAVARGSWAVFVLDDAWVSPEAVRQDPYADWNPLAVWVEPGDRRTVDLVAVRCARVRGTVVEADGRPAAAAVVESWPKDGDLWSSICNRLPQAASAADGSFDVGVLPDRDVTMTARRGQFRSDNGEVSATSAGAAAAAKIAFRAPAFLDLIVRAADGTPVGGAALHLDSHSGCLHFDYGDWRTRADGRVRAGPLSIATPSVEVVAEGFVDADVEVPDAAESPFAITLTPGRRIAGTIVLPKAAPRGDLWLDVTRLPAAGGGGDERKVETIRAADDGSFRTRSLARGRYRVDARFTLPDGRTWIGSNTAVTDGAALRVDLAPAGGAPRAWTVRVVDADGRAVPRASVSVRAQQPIDWSGVAGRVESGVASVDVPPDAGPLWVRVDDVAGADGAPCGIASGVAGPFDARAPDATIRLAAAKPIAGTAHRDDGSAMPGLTIRAVAAVDPSQGVVGPPWAITRTRADGAFELRGLPAGRYRIRSEPPEGLTATEPVVEAGESRVEVVVGHGIAATVRVLDWQRKPVEGATVVVKRPSENHDDVVAANSVDAKGELRVERLAAGKPYQLHVSPPRPRGDLAEFDDAAWTAKDTEIVLAREYVLGGAVSDADGRGVVGVVVWARAAGGRWASAETRDGGAFTIPHVGGADAEVVVVRSGEPGDRAPAKIAIGDDPVRLRYDPGPSIELNVERTVEVTLGNAGMDLEYRAMLVLGDGPGGPLAATQIVREGHAAVFDHLEAGATYSLWLAADPDVRTWSLDGKCAFREGLVPGKGTVTVTPAPGRSIEGRITAPGRALPTNVRVTAALGALRCAAEVSGDHFVARGLVEGLWTIEAAAGADGRVLTGSAQAAAGDSADVELRVR